MDQKLYIRAPRPKESRSPTQPLKLRIMAEVGPEPGTTLITSHTKMFNQFPDGLDLWLCSLTNISPESCSTVKQVAHDTHEDAILDNFILLKSLLVSG